MSVFAHRFRGEYYTSVRTHVKLLCWRLETENNVDMLDIRERREHAKISVLTILQPDFVPLSKQTLSAGRPHQLRRIRGRGTCHVFYASARKMIFVFGGNRS